MKISPGTYQDVAAYQEPSLGLLGRCFLFVGEQWNAHRYPGTNVPYWSLGFEVWYYIVFASFVFVPTRWRWIASVSVLVFIGPKVAVMFPVWLMGVATYRICVAAKITREAGWIFLAAPLVLLGIYEVGGYSLAHQFVPVAFKASRLLSLLQDYFIAAVFSIHLIGFATVSSIFAPWLERHARTIRWIAGATFTLYLAHLPLLYFLSAVCPWPKSSYNRLGYLLVLTPLMCLLLAELSERRKAVWHRGILTLVNWTLPKLSRRYI
jgi:peptidoglycan/LPS O-acetylase OafA/YrhL